jgi:N-acetylglutamate synthase-like GNAT family acetyltransferase
MKRLHVHVSIDNLADAIKNRARRTGVGTLHLLTAMAADFFRRRGYEVIERAKASATLQATTEFLL